MKPKELTKQQALTLLALSRDYHAGKIGLPAHILKKKKEVKDAEQNAYLFIVRTGAVDYGMIDQVVDLRMDLDTLYALWTQQEEAASPLIN